MFNGVLYFLSFLSFSVCLCLCLLWFQNRLHSFVSFFFCDDSPFISFSGKKLSFKEVFFNQRRPVQMTAQEMEGFFAPKLFFSVFHFFYYFCVNICWMKRTPTPFSSDCYQNNFLRLQRNNLQQIGLTNKMFSFCNISIFISILLKNTFF